MPHKLFQNKFLYLIFSIIILVFSILWISSNDTSYGTQNTYMADIETIENGQSLFVKNCIACHYLQEEGIGPPLGGVTSELTKKELIQFVQNPSAVINSGDQRANYLLDRYKSPMPGFPFLTEEELTSLFAYIDNQSKKNGLTNAHIDFKRKTDKTIRYAKPISFDSLVIELEDPIYIPLAQNRNSRKGIATLRTTPALKNTLFVSDQMGKLYFIKDKTVSLFLDVAANFSTFIFEPGHGTGLGSFAFHPNFENNGLIYTTHAEKSQEENIINKTAIPDQDGLEIQWVLTEWKLNHITDVIFTGSKREVFRITAPTHAHGVQDINFNSFSTKGDEDYGMLYIGVGDGGSINRRMPELANQIRTPLGAILRIDPLGNNSENGQYGIPKNNPFAKNLENQTEVFANGFRNPHRFCWSKDGVMLATDVGESNVEELNIVEAGKNYGWNKMEGSYGLNTMKDAKVLHEASPELLSKYELPFAAYDHHDGNAISGGYIFDGKIKDLRNKYLFGDIVNGRIFYISTENNFQNDRIFELKIYRDKKPTSLKDLIGFKNTNLRFGYDENNKELYIMTKNDGGIRKVVNAYYLKNNEKFSTAAIVN